MIFGGPNGPPNKDDCFERFSSMVYVAWIGEMTCCLAGLSRESVLHDEYISTIECSPCEA